MDESGTTNSSRPGHDGGRVGVDHGNGGWREGTATGRAGSAPGWADDVWLHPRLGADDPPGMARGVYLRHAVLHLLSIEGAPRTVREIVDGLARYAISVPGPRPTKTVADSLRWEVERGRVRKLGRDRYEIGRLPRSTGYKARSRFLLLRNEGLAVAAAASRLAPPIHRPPSD